MIVEIQKSLKKSNVPSVGLWSQATKDLLVVQSVDIDGKKEGERKW